MHNVSLDLTTRECLAVVGHNGAGKTTVLKSILGIIPPINGSIRVLGKEMLLEQDLTEFDVTDMLWRVTSAGVGYAPEDRRIFSGLTVDENLKVAVRNTSSVEGAFTPEIIYEQLPILKKLKNRLGFHLSGGEKQILSMARALMGNPTILFLDEPTAGLSPKIVELVASYLKQLRDKGLSMIIVDQNYDFLDELAQSVVMMQLGTAMVKKSWTSFRDEQRLEQDALKKELS